MRPNRQRGLTLLEVMVALFIFAMTGTAILKAASDHLRGVGIIQDLTFATWVANNRISELSLTTKWPLSHNQKGNQELAERQWYWTQKVEKTADSELVQVVIEVYSDEQRSRPVTSVTSYIAKRGRS